METVLNQRETTLVSSLGATYTALVSRPQEPQVPDESSLQRALAKQVSDDDHDAGLIVERLAWTPEQRLEANAAFLRFYQAVRPAGPLIREE